MRNRFQRWWRRVRGVGVSLTGASISWGPDEPDRELVAELKIALDDPRVDKLVPAALISYYTKKKSSLQFFRNRESVFPILHKEEWIADPLAHPTGLHPRLTLAGRRPPATHPPLAKEYRVAIDELNRHFDDNPVFAASAIGSVEEGGIVPIDVQIAKYSDYVFTAEILNAELRLGLARSSQTAGQDAFPIRDFVGLLDFDRYVAKIGLNVLTVKRTGSEHRFYVMDRSHMVMQRPLEYPNAIHVVPAGTVQPEGKEFRDNSELRLEATLTREFGEELLGSAKKAQLTLPQALMSGSARFFITGLGIDALTHKLEICGLLMLENEFPLGDGQVESDEGLINTVDRKELEAIGKRLNETLPAGALAIWQGLRYVDALLHSHNADPNVLL